MLKRMIHDFSSMTDACKICTAQTAPTLLLCKIVLVQVSHRKDLCIQIQAPSNLCLQEGMEYWVGMHALHEVGSSRTGTADQSSSKSTRCACTRRGPSWRAGGARSSSKSSSSWQPTSAALAFSCPALLPALPCSPAPSALAAPCF